MLDGGIAMSFNSLCSSTFFISNTNKNRVPCSIRSNTSVSAKLSSMLVKTGENMNSSGSSKTSNPSSMLNQANTVGIIGGISVLSTLIFLEKLVFWSSRNGKNCVPFVVHSDPSMKLNRTPIVENLRRKRAFLEQSGARCIVMPCHVWHAWHDEVSAGCALPFLHAGECVAKELKEAKLKPLEGGCRVKIGVLATDATLMAGFYQEKLQNQGFEVVLLDKETMKHTIIPAIEALNRKDMEGARNLLRIAVQVLLVRAVNTVILAADEIQGVLPHDDPLLKKCIDPMDALARSTIKWARTIGNTT